MQEHGSVDVIGEDLFQVCGEEELGEGGRDGGVGGKEGGRGWLERDGGRRGTFTNVEIRAGARASSSKQVLDIMKEQEGGRAGRMQTDRRPYLGRAKGKERCGTATTPAAAA